MLLNIYLCGLYPLHEQRHELVTRLLVKDCLILQNARNLIRYSTLYLMLAKVTLTNSILLLSLMLSNHLFCCLKNLNRCDTLCDGGPEPKTSNDLLVILKLAGVLLFLIE